MSLVSDITAWYSAHMSYWSIGGLMAVESSFIPFPSEVVVPPAAYVVGVDSASALCVSEHYWVNVALIILVASLGAILGAVINYALSVWLGRLIIYKFADSRLGHMLLLSSEKIQRAEAYFNEHGKVSTFVGRLIPGIRQLISIPAGLARMNFGAFLGYTFLGASIWNTVLALLGVVAKGNQDLIEQYSHELSIGILAVLALVVIWFIVKYILKSKKA